METLVVASQHRSQRYGRNDLQFTDRFASSVPRGFKAMNCRAFESSAGILPSPSSVTPLIHAAKEPKSPCFYSEPRKPSKWSNPISITQKPSRKAAKEMSCSELWAGPAYSSSPPPSSLPMPKFSLREKRSVSLDLPVLKSVVEFHPVAKSAPSSPKREYSLSGCDCFVSTASATETLRRILHLDD